MLVEPLFSLLLPVLAPVYVVADYLRSKAKEYYKLADAQVVYLAALLPPSQPLPEALTAHGVLAMP
eukprot:15467572-Alexandrium_andersonii.AAC.1